MLDIWFTQPYRISIERENGGKMTITLDHPVTPIMHALRKPTALGSETAS
jgi:hypothetical protein